MSRLYENPRYYEIAFSHRDIPAEVKTIRNLIDQYSQIPVETVLELACGNSPHMEEFLKYGYRYLGLDISPEMLAYSREKAQRLEKEVTLIHGNLVDFSLPSPVDFACVFVGSLYVQTTQELISHFQAVHKALKPGGLYFLEHCVEYGWIADTEDDWIAEKDGITVHVHYSTELLDCIEQTFTEKVNLTIYEQGKTRRINNTAIRRAIYPQEFLMITNNAGFDFIGWWDDWNINRPLTGKEEVITRPLALLRRR